MLESTCLAHEFVVQMRLRSRSSNVFPHHYPTLGCTLVVAIVLSTPFIITLPTMAAEIWRVIWIQVGSSVCIQALARVLQSGRTQHWSFKCWRRRSSKELRKISIQLIILMPLLAHLVIAPFSLHSSVAPMSPCHFFKPRKHLKNNMSVKLNTISPNVSLIK